MPNFRSIEIKSLRLVKYIIPIVLSLFVSFSILWRKKSKALKVVIFDCYDHGLYEHIEHYLRIVKSIDQCLIIILTEKTNIKILKSAEMHIDVLDISVAPYLLFVDIYITPHIHISSPPSAYVVHVSHNQPIKYPSLPQKAMRKIHEHFVWGKLMMDYYARMQNECETIRNQKFIEIGNPRIDYELSKFQPHESSPSVIGYAPSWDSGLSMRQYGMDIITQVSLLEEFQLIVKLHPVLLTERDHPDYNLYTGGYNWKEKVGALPKVRLFDGPSSYKFLDDIDILVTDLSSFSFDAFLMDKPVIFYHTDQFWDEDVSSTYRDFGYSSYSGIPQEDLLINGGRFAGIVVSDIPELVSAILLYSRFPEYKAVERSRIREVLLYNKGVSETFARNRLRELLGNKEIYTR